MKRWWLVVFAGDQASLQYKADRVGRGRSVSQGVSAPPNTMSSGAALRYSVGRGRHDQHRPRRQYQHHHNSHGLDGAIMMIDPYKYIDGPAHKLVGQHEKREEAALLSAVCRALLMP